MGIQVQMLVGERKQVHPALLDPADRRSLPHDGPGRRWITDAAVGQHGGGLLPLVRGDNNLKVDLLERDPRFAPQA